MTIGCSMLNTKPSPPQNNATQDYAHALLEIREQIEKFKNEAISSVNRALNHRNWIIGKIISEKQAQYNWGSNILATLAKDLQNAYPGNKGFSKANVYRMMAFYQAYRNFRAAARKLKKLPFFEIPWFHNVIILENIKISGERLWYAQKALENGWSRSTLETQIKHNLYGREGKAITNFKETLAAHDSTISQQAFKDPYVFEFLKLPDSHFEQDLENGLIVHVQKLLLELGKGFAFIGRQFHIEIDEEDYYIDLLFYHTRLKCYIVVELKARAFDPGDVGKLNFYLSACDDLLRDAIDKPTIGLLLCKTKKNFTAEYALRGYNKPISIAAYETEILKKLPKELKGSLPTIEELEAELEKREALNKKE